MTSKTRFEGQQIVNSLNLFIDTERACIVSDKQSKGDNLHYNFEGNTIECKDGEVIRLSLVDFYMPNNEYTIDAKNSMATLKCTINGTAMAAGVVKDVITRGNYYDVHDVAINFASTLAASLQAIPNMTAFTVLSITNHNLVLEGTAPTGWTIPVAGAPGAGYVGKPEKKLLDVEFQTSTNHLITDLVISCLITNGETYLVLGGERIDDTNNLTSSFKITLTANTIRVQGYYPMQLITEPHAYLRCSLGQNGLESSILSTDDTIYNNDIVGSNILAKIPRNVENYSYAGNSQNEFFLTLQQRKLNSIGLFLTDSKNRPIGRSKNSGKQTCAGLENTSVARVNNDINYEKETQSTLGNLYFTATIRVDIIKVNNPNTLDTEPPAFPSIPRKASGVISFGSPTGIN
jgi:hypothetical protein